MLATRSAQVGMFDAAVVMGPLPEGSFYALLAEHGDRIVRDQDFVECYSARMGRPSIPPSQLAKVLVLQHRTGVSDEDAMECVRWDLRWKAALDLPVDHRGWHPTSLTKFRARLLLHKKDGLALENTLKLAHELGLLDGPVEQIVDSTPMLGAAATQDTVRLVRFGVRKLIEAVTAVDADAGVLLAAGLEFNYQRPGEKPECQWRIKAERERMLTRVAQDAQRALSAVEQADGLLDHEPVKDAYDLLVELIGQDFDVDQDDVPRLHRGTRRGRIISTIDPEMQHGRKSSSQRFDGFKLSAAVSNTSEPLIMAVHVAPGGEADGPQAKHLIDSQPDEHRPNRILGDTAYGNGPVRKELADRDVDVLAPVPEGEVLEGRVGKRDFVIDPAAGTVICPAGHTATITTSKKGVRTARISRAVCGSCPLKDQCCPGRPSRQITLGEHEELIVAARQALADPETATHLRHTRPRIERLLGLLAVRYGARKSRYLGTEKATLQANLAAALVNLNPLGRHLSAGTA
ncbi:MAG TPA: IS1182 family transposase [Mycobacteriales bacterium]|nr:IS1182 family transposase [Mycobacteriales bacterium]